VSLELGQGLRPVGDSSESIVRSHSLKCRYFIMMEIKTKLLTGYLACYCTENTINYLKPHTVINCYLKSDDTSSFIITCNWDY
jgi:hypothetical protein